MDFAVAGVQIRYLPSTRSTTCCGRLLEQLFKITAEAVVEKSVAVEDRWMTDMHQFLMLPV